MSEPISEPGSVDALIERYKPASDTYDIVFPTGEVFRFRCLPRLAAQKEFDTMSLQWATSIPLRDSEGAAAHPWREHLPATLEEAQAAYKISSLSVAPRITQLEALKLLTVPNLAQFLLDKIDENSNTILAVWFAEHVKLAKKNSTPIPGTESGSASDSSSSASTPTT